MLWKAGKRNDVSLWRNEAAGVLYITFWDCAGGVCVRQVRMFVYVKTFCVE